MGKVRELWMTENERILEEYSNGELTLAEAGDLLISQGFDPNEARETLQELEVETIPKGYFGEEKC